MVSQKWTPLDFTTLLMSISKERFRSRNFQKIRTSWKLCHKHVISTLIENITSMYF